MHDDRVFPEARDALNAFLEHLDTQFDGLLEGAYIIGSIALGDGHPGSSDIDLVLVRASGIGNDQTIRALESALAALRMVHPRPFFDGIVVDPSDLAAGPAAMTGERPVIFDNAISLPTSGSAWTPVTWATLRQCGIPWRGLPVAELDVWDDPEALANWTLGNLQTYWAPWLARSDRLFSRFGAWSLRPGFVEWGVLGVTRLHATLATGTIVSKTAAGTYALDQFPARWHPIVREAMRIRSGGAGGTSYPTPLHRRRDARAYIRTVIDSAQQFRSGITP